MINKNNRAFGRFFSSLAEIQADALAGILEPGMGYQSNDAGVPSRLFYAASATVLRPWLIESEVQTIADAAVLVEKNRAVGVEANLFQNIATEEQARIQGDLDEATARGAAIANLNTALTAAFNSSVEMLQDSKLNKSIFINYADGDTATLASLLPTPLVEGVTPIKFLSSDVLNVSDITGLPAGTPFGTGDISYGDVLKVTVDNGVITSVVKEDDILRLKFGGIDTSINDLYTKVTPSAVRGHLSAGTFMSFVNGTFSFNNSADADNDLGESPNDGGLKINVGSTVVPFTDGTGAETTGAVGATFTTLFGQVAAINANGAFGAHNGLTKTGSNVGLGGQLAVGGAFVDFNGETLRFDGGSFHLDADTFMPVYQTDANGYPTTRVAGVRRQIFIDVQGNINTIIPN